MLEKKKVVMKSDLTRTCLLTVLVAVTLISTASLALAAPEITVTPDNTTVGAKVNITGSGFSPDENITLTTTVTCWKPIVDGKCECTMEDFEIRAGVWFKLSVSEVTDNVSIFIKKLVWWPPVEPGTPGFAFYYNPTTYTSNVSTTLAVPVGGRYNIDVIGDAVNDSGACTMSTTATMYLQADASGNFSVDEIDTTGIPICPFNITAKGQTSGTAYADLNLLLRGDASKDGQVNSYDCCCIARCIAELPGYCTCCPYTSSTISISAGDVDGTPGLSIEDARWLAEALVGIHPL